jgi:hypothetical protein
LIQPVRVTGPVHFAATLRGVAPVPAAVLDCGPALLLAATCSLCGSAIDRYRVLLFAWLHRRLIRGEPKLCGQSRCKAEPYSLLALPGHKRATREAEAEREKPGATSSTGPLRAAKSLMACCTRHPAALLAAAAILLILLTATSHGLDLALYIDEAHRLVLAKHFAQTAQYAVDVAGQPLRWFEPVTSTGPTVIMPIAVLGRILGFEPARARLIPLAYFALFLVAVYLTAHRRSGELAGAIAVITLGIAAHDLYDISLSIAGDTLSLALLCLSAAALIAFTPRSAFISGFLLALAILTKPQMVVPLPIFLCSTLVLALTRGSNRLTIITSTIIGLSLPLVLWNTYQIAVVGPAYWLKLITIAFVRSTDMSGASRLPVASIAVFALLPLGLGLSFLFSLRRAPPSHGALLRPGLLARLLLAAIPVCILPLLRWDAVLAGLADEWRSYPLETGMALAGLSLGFLIGLLQLDIAMLYLCITALLFAQLYFGTVSDIYRLESIYWRAIGLLQFAVLLDSVVTWLNANLLRPQLPKMSIDGARIWNTRLAAHVCGILSLYLLLDRGLDQTHNMAQIRSNYALDNGAELLAEWLLRNTPDDAVLVGSGYWLPWEASLRTNRSIAEATSSGFSTIDELRRPWYLIVGGSQQDMSDLSQEVVDITSRNDLLLYRTGKISVYRWPNPGTFTILDEVHEAKVDLIPRIAEGDITLSPKPEKGLLDSKYGHFIFPMVSQKIVGVTMISEAEMRLDGVSVKSGDSLLLGYEPPDLGDGLTLTVSLADGRERRMVWNEYVETRPRALEAFQVRLVPLPEVDERPVSLTVRVTSEPSGDGAADWLFVGPLAVVR